MEDQSPSLIESDSDISIDISSGSDSSDSDDFFDTKSEPDLSLSSDAGDSDVDTEDSDKDVGTNVKQITSPSNIKSDRCDDSDLSQCKNDNDDLQSEEKSALKVSDLRKKFELNNSGDKGSCQKETNDASFKKTTFFTQLLESQSVKLQPSLLLQKCFSEANLPQTKNTSCNDHAGKYVWQTVNKVNSEKKEQINSIKEENEMTVESEPLKKSNTIASGEPSAKEKTFVWHGSQSTPALTKDKPGSKNAINVSEKKISFKTSYINSFEEAKTTFTWNMMAHHNKKLTTEAGKDAQAFTKPSDLYQNNILRLQEQLNKMREENTKLKEKPKQVKTKLEMSLLQARLLKPYFNTQQNDCSVHYVEHEKAAVLIGLENLVQEFQTKLAKELQNIKEDSFSISGELFSLMNGEKGKQFLNDLDLKGAITVVEDGLVKVAAKDKSIQTQALNILKAKLEGEKIITFVIDKLDEKFINLKLRLEHELLININCQGNVIKITGIVDDVVKGSKSVYDYIGEIGECKSLYTKGEPESRFLYYFMEDKIESILKPVQILEKSIKEYKIDIKFKGKKTIVQSVSQNLQDLQKNIKITVWLLKEDFKDHELFLIVNSYQSKKNIVTSNYKEKYLVTLQIPDSVKMLPFYQKARGVQSAKQKSNTVQSFPKGREHDALSDKVVRFNVGNRCQLTIKSEGDITSERSDILVSVLGPDIDMRKTAVGMSFHKLCPNHWKAVKAYHNSTPHAKIIIVQHPEGLNCLAVCHIILSTWDSRSSRAQLTAALNCVLDEAKCLGAKSISFPPLGCGRMFKFPTDVVADLMIKSFKDNDIGTFLQDVVVLAPESELFNKLKNNSASYYQIKNSNQRIMQNLQASSGTDENELVDGINIQSHGSTLRSVQMLIFTQQDANVQEIKLQLTREIRDQFLQTEAIKQHSLESLPKSSWKKILKEAIEHNVWIEKFQNSSTRNIEFHLTGQKGMLAHLKTLINLECENLTSHLPKNRLASAQTPKRGTVDFLKYASESDDHFPSYWSLNNNKIYWQKIKEEKIVHKTDFNILVDVDQPTRDAITNMFLNTQDQVHIGHGADAKGLKYSKLKVLDVKRVENPELFDNYRRERQLLVKKMIRMGRICANIADLPNSYGEVATARWVPDFMKRELFSEINEHYLFHGAKSDAITTLINNGLDPRVSNNCMFGKGVYTAEKSTKADQYSDMKDQRVSNGTQLQIIITRMLLGNVFLCDENHKTVAIRGGKKLTRPPCMKCLEDICTCHDQILFDSVMGNGRWLFREFVVYEGRHCYPEYVITYQRT
ncbi:poly [ADP-ribose] polymerase 10/14/15 [Biomphalaria glabrata]|nr:poly [ADP-ribose] polymerase 10/14/15 [Biomphalaria glabrata]